MTNPQNNNNTITGIIQKQITATLQTQPHPTIVTITKVHSNGYCDVKNKEYGELQHIPSITTHQKGDTTVLLFLNNDYNSRIII